LTAADRSKRNQHLCSVFSQANGEHPGGTAPSWTRFLLVEVRKPWAGAIEETEHFPSGVTEIADRAEESGGGVELRAFAPDPEYSSEGHTRVMLFSRPDGPFASFDKDDFLAPSGEIGPLVEALVLDRSRLAQWDAYRQDTSAVREILVCSHGSHDTCCATFGFPVYDALRNQHAKRSGGALRVWQTSHLGGHRFAPNVFDLPEGRNWVRLGVGDLDALTERTGPPPVEGHYRGWTGLDTLFEQMAERELFMREGWAWTEKSVAGRVLSFDEGRQRAEVRLDVVDGEGSVVYEATVEQTGTAPRVECPGGEPKGGAAQFAVSRLAKVG